MRSRLAVLAFLAASAPTARVLAAPGVPCSFYGMNAGAPVRQGDVIFDEKYAGDIAAAGAHEVRVSFRLDGAAAWDDDKLAEYDGIVDAAIAKQLQPVGLLAHEAVLGEQSDWNDDPDGDGNNDYVDAFADMSQLLFEHFRGRIRRWEIWNEPNCWSNPNYATDPQNAGCTYLLPRVFAKMLAEVYVRNEELFAEGSVSMISGGLLAHDIGGSFSTGTDYLDEVYSEGVWDSLEATEGRRYPWDRLGYHLYVDQGTLTDGATISDYLSPVRELAGQNNDSSRFSITEIGWTTIAVSEDVQAENLTTAIGLLSVRADVADAHWFSYRDEPEEDQYFGLTTEGGAPKAALSAFEEAADGCEGGGEGGGDGTSAASGGSVGEGATVGGDYGGYDPSAHESSCSCDVAGAEGRARTSAWLLALAGAVLLRRGGVPGYRGSLRRRSLS